MPFKFVGKLETVTVERNGDDVSATVTGRSLRFVLAFEVSQTAHGRVERFSTEERP